MTYLQNEAGFLLAHPYCPFQKLTAKFQQLISTRTLRQNKFINRIRQRPPQQHACHHHLSNRVYFFCVPNEIVSQFFNKKCICYQLNGPPHDGQILYYQVGKKNKKIHTNLSAFVIKQNFVINQEFKKLKLIN